MLEDLLFFLLVVKSLLIDKLPQELYGRLRSILFLYWHVQVIDVNDHLWYSFWTNHIFAASLIKFSLNLFLNLSASSPRAEHNV